MKCAGRGHAKLKSASYTERSCASMEGSNRTLLKVISILFLIFGVFSVITAVVGIIGGGLLAAAGAPGAGILAALAVIIGCLGGIFGIYCGNKRLAKQIGAVPHAWYDPFGSGCAGFDFQRIPVYVEQCYRNCTADPLSAGRKKAGLRKNGRYHRLTRGRVPQPDRVVVSAFCGGRRSGTAASDCSNAAGNACP